jgi:hypothetical protein
MTYKGSILLINDNGELFTHHTHEGEVHYELATLFHSYEAH